MVVNIISIKGNGRYDRMRKRGQMRRVNADGLSNADGFMRTVEFGGRMRTVNAEGGMRTVECGGCGRSKLDADSRIRRSYFWHELSSIHFWIAVNIFFIAYFIHVSLIGDTIGLIGVSRNRSGQRFPFISTYY